MQRIVVIDDEPLVAQTLSLILTHAGYEVESFVEPERALDVLRLRPASLVLTDMLMPTMDGIQLAAKVSASWPQCHVLILSGRHRPNPAGPLDFGWAPFEIVYKPIYPDDLLSIVARMLRVAPAA